MTCQPSLVGRTVLPVVAAFLLTISTRAEERTDAQDKERLQGTWTLTARETGGQSEKIAPDQRRHHRLIFVGQRAERRYWDPSRLDRFSDDSYFGQEPGDDVRVTYFDSNPNYTFKVETVRNVVRLIFYSRYNFGPEGRLAATFALEGDSLKVHYPAKTNERASTAVYQRVNRPVKVAKTWDGQLKARGDAALRKDAPAAGCITTSDQWAKLWKAWKRTDALPEIDFDQSLILLHTIGGPRDFEIVPELDGQGDLTMLCLLGEVPPPDPDAESGPAPGFSYRLLAIPRKGIKSIGGQAIE